MRVQQPSIVAACVLGPAIGVADQARWRPAVLQGHAHGVDREAPLEPVGHRVKALLRRAAARTRETLWEEVGRILDTFTPPECANYFTAAGYEPE
jgi:hypothetical protein